ncbi:MAG: hypothetical protein M1828_006906 [Chrysothrix sp. TS-e1954]|nr:MAG: hypothetical protein M1828_006906 [Chrysothrix sp. TS-e1954]
MSTGKASRVVFIGNIPYGQSEEQVTDIFSSVGQVNGFRLVHDKETGRPKGFGFMEFSDADAAASAVRNLNDHEINGRRLRVDWSNDGNANVSNSTGNDTGNNAQQQMQSMQQQMLQNGPPPPLPQGQTGNIPQLPQGSELPPNVSCPDAISRTLKSVHPPLLLDTISQMKNLCTTDPAKANELFAKAPQLSYAMFQALLLLGLVDTTVLAQVVQQAQPQPPPPMPVPQQQQQQQAPQFPPQPPMPFQHMQSQFQHMNTMTPPTQNQFRPPQPPAPPPQMDSHQALKQKVMTMTQQEIQNLPPDTQQQILQLRQQIMSGAI